MFIVNKMSGEREVGRGTTKYKKREVERVREKGMFI
jgi:hypothetical protein